MPQFYASTSKGLSQALAKELRTLAINVSQTDSSGCLFDGPWSDCIKANLHSRIATRISLPVLDFPAYREEQIYNNIDKHDFTRYLKADGRFFIKAKVKNCFIRDQRLLAMKFKDVICDQFKKKYGMRPSIDKESAQVRFFIFGSSNQYHVSVDTTGYSLSKRGYRKNSTKAPLREHLAAGLILMTHWDHELPLVDPLCGSGTLLIESALILKNISPGSFHKKFVFQYFSHIPKKIFDTQLDQALLDEKDGGSQKQKLFGFDKNEQNIRSAMENAKWAGVDDLIVFKRANALSLTPPAPRGLIVTNPPCGVRLGDEFFLEEFYKNFSHNLKRHFSGWDLWLLSGSAKWTVFLKMKAKESHPIDNGGISSRWIHYPVKS